MRVAVVGARGIGRYHAKWAHAAGAEVVAVVGADEARLRATTDQLGSLFPFQGRAYTDIARMLREERPDVVAVATPPDRHLEPAAAALEAGCHVYVEKPLAWIEGRPAAEWLGHARELVALADRRGVLLGINTQYSAVWEAYRAIASPPAAPRSLYVEIETSNLPADREHERIWIDVGSHPISVLLAIAPEVRLGPDPDVRFDQLETTVQCLLISSAGPIEARFICRRVDGRPTRRLGVDGRIAEYEVRQASDGEAYGVLRLDGAEHRTVDAMRECIARFLAAVAERTEASVVATGATGLRNLELQVALASLGRRS